MELASSVVLVCVILFLCATTPAVVDCLVYGPTMAATRERTGELETPSLSRLKRTLVYPNSSTLLLIFGLGTPLQLDRESVIVGAFAKMIYALPSNGSVSVEPSRGSGSRWSLYRVLGRLLELYGLGEGRACVLRAICEAASVPFDERQGGGLLHALLQTFLSPSRSSDEYEEYRDREYRAAERLGEHIGDNCHALYPECRRSLLDVFSRARIAPAA